MAERMEGLRERVAQAIYERVFTDAWPTGRPEYRDDALMAADAALTALGLDDLDAAAERLWDVLALSGSAADRQSMEYDAEREGDWSAVVANHAMYLAALEAALTATEKTGPRRSPP